MSADDPLIRTENLTKYYSTESGFLDRLLGEDKDVKAVDGVDIEIKEGETLGLVGESGCGKSSLGRTLLQLEDVTAGSAYYRDGTEEVDLAELSNSEMREYRKDLQFIFQNPFASLNPRLTIADIIGEPLDVHGIASGDERQERIEELLETVGLQASHAGRYPHEFSGGQRQRIGIARALAVDPDFIVCDEPVSALDVSVQAQILNLLMDLQEELGLSYLFIAHDLSVVEHIADRIAVMYLGEIVEVGTPEEVFTEPHHPYTEALLSAIPEPDPLWESDRVLLKGTVPSPMDPPSGCKFHTRCPRVIPPEGMDIEQEAFRSIMDLRVRIADREVGTEYAWEQVEERNPESDREKLREEFVAELREQELDTEPDGVHRERVDEAIELLAEDDFEAAGELLRKHYESVCETREPTLGDGENPKSCHLFDVDETGDIPEAEGDARDGAIGADD
ncbi:ABC transporter ATP-binding protein [Natronomonas gomsonensis]|uniref:ABC transporter ATP-binding protein n=1 Tax=Natronomonas gomsonensis TaxID=1046043 RepID=UPI0015C0376D|nr:oligopeptide/dipeptide ABC transporter ATP-binding protein [Natronomonas gomsonensis]